GPIQDDERHVAERLDVVHRCWTVVETFDGREWRFESRLGALAFERFDERRLLTGLVCAGAAMHEDVAVEPAAEDVAAQITRFVRPFNLRFEDLLTVEELAADVDVGDLRAN